MAESTFFSRVTSTLRGVFDRVVEDPRRTVHFYPLPAQAAGITLTYDAATQLSCVWACMDAITKAIAPSAWRVFVRENRKRVMLPDDPVAYLLNTRPNPEMTAMSFRECLMYQALSWGNSYAEIVRDGSGRVTALWPLMSDRMMLRRYIEDDGTPGDLYYEYYNWQGPITRFEPNDIFHLRGPSPSGWFGDNIIARAAKTIALGVAMERFSSSFFANGASAGLVLSNDRPFDDKAYEKVKARWNDEHLGPDKASRTAVLDNGWKISSISTEPDKMELVASRKYQLEEICRFFGVPPHRVQELSRATFNNIEHLGLEFVRDALTPWAERLEQEADFKLFPQRAPWRHTNIDIDWLAHGDAGSRAAYYEKMRNMGAFSVNDILEKENMNSVGAEGDLRLVMSNYTTYEGIQAMVDQTNLENEQLRKGKPDPTPTLVDPKTPVEGDDVGFAKALPEVFAAAPALTAGAPEVPVRAAEALAGACVALAQGALERYARRLQNRRKDLERTKAPAQVAVALAEERAKQRPRLVEELREAVGWLAKPCAIPLPVGSLLSAADQVDNGMPPLEAATLLIQHAARHVDAQLPGDAP